MLTGAFGFLQGWKPDLHLTEYVSKPARVQILTISPVFFPEDVISKIEKETRTRIYTRVIKNWEDLRLQMISDSQTNLVFLPEAWVQALRQEDLLHESRRLQDLKSDLASPDFNFNSTETRQDFLPLYWAQLSFYFQEPDGKTLNFPDDAGMYLDLVTKSASDKNFGKLKISLVDWVSWWNDPRGKADIFLAPHPLQQTNPKWKPDVTRPAWLAIWGFALPKNSHLGPQDVAVIRAYADPERQSEILRKLPLASTLTSLDEKTGSLEKKAIYLRDIKMAKLSPIKQYNPKDIEQAKRQVPALIFSR